MTTNSYCSINAGGRLIELSQPMVMGILNVTPDSFYENSRQEQEADIAQRARQIVDEGGLIIDIGAYSTRPGATDVSVEEECRRLRYALSVVKRVVPDTIISVDTFRADVARMCVEEFGVHIINDVSGGQADRNMLKTIARLNVPYVLTHAPNFAPNAAQADTTDVVRHAFLFFAERVNRLHDAGVNDVVLDPGFGFGKTLEQNYTLMQHLQELHEFALPILVGVSRKSMVYRLLETEADNALNGTTALHAIALEKGAHLLRVHDVKAACEVVKIHRQLHTTHNTL